MTMQLGLFDKIEAASRDEEHMARMRRCWPEWDGPREGLHCQVGQICAEHEADGVVGYHYTERCRLLHQREDGCWIAVIDHAQDTLESAPWMAASNGVRLVLPLSSIWPPVDDLWKDRLGTTRSHEPDDVREPASGDTVGRDVGQ